MYKHAHKVFWWFIYKGVLLSNLLHKFQNLGSIGRQMDKANCFHIIVWRKRQRSYDPRRNCSKCGNDTEDDHGDGYQIVSCILPQGTYILLVYPIKALVFVFQNLSRKSFHFTCLPAVYHVCCCLIHETMRVIYWVKLCFSFSERVVHKRFVEAKV